jgi:hypothetical protein
VILAPWSQIASDPAIATEAWIWLFAGDEPLR